MTFIFKLILIVLTSFSGLAFAENSSDNGPASSDTTSYRSKYSDKFWFSIKGGWDPIGNDLRPPAFRDDFSVRFQLNRFVGVIVNYHQEWLDTSPDLGVATGRSSFWALGYSAAFSFAKQNRFWHGATLVPHVMVQYGHTTYHFGGYSNSSGAEVALGDGSMNEIGFAVGADFYVPIYVGFWASLGVGVEATNFDYPSVTDPRGDDLSLPSTLPYGRIGIAYSF